QARDAPRRPAPTDSARDAGQQRSILLTRRQPATSSGDICEHSRSREQYRSGSALLCPESVAVQVVQRPVQGPASGTFRWIGYSPSAKNPAVCARCVARAPKGGAVVPVSVVMAGVRGYTQMTERLSATQVPEGVNRFYEA